MILSIANRYADAARQHGECTRRSDPEGANKAYFQMIEALRKLREAPDRGESALLELTKHSDEWVKVWASTHLLPISEQPALEVLKHLAGGSTGIIQFDAKMVLQEWESGNLRSL